jgi:hypothetical protein
VPLRVRQCVGSRLLTLAVWRYVLDLFARCQITVTSDGLELVVEGSRGCGSIKYFRGLILCCLVPTISPPPRLVYASAVASWVSNSRRVASRLRWVVSCMSRRFTSISFCAKLISLPSLEMRCWTLRGVTRYVVRPKVRRFSFVCQAHLPFAHYTLTRYI